MVAEGLKRAWIETAPKIGSVHSVAFAACLLAVVAVSGCAKESGSQPRDEGADDAKDPGDETPPKSGEDDDDDDDADDDDDVQPPSPGNDAAAPSRPKDAGGLLDSAAGGGAQADARVSTTVDANVDGRPVGALDGGNALDAGAEDASAASDAGVSGAVDYGKRGPYEVVVEKNVGRSFRNNVNDDTAFCSGFIGAIGGSNSEVNKELTTYPADMDRGLYTLFRPSQLQEGKKYPVLTWGNGTCSHPLLFDELIEHVASHGYIVIASNSRQVGDGQVMLRGVDFIVSENENMASALYGKVDTVKIGAFGHSQGSGATLRAAADRRIIASVPIQGAQASAVRNVKGPTFLIAGENDNIVTPASVRTGYEAATVPAVYGLSVGQDHLMPGLDPAKIWDAVVGWFKIHLDRDDAARSLFYGSDCRLCSDPRWKLERKNLQ